ncbi:MAG: hypothetical protein CR972_04170 [Candidatus Moraniibacteriota bacterium]|nr:MAG: hypothetical protein CR972_04170 [Candidatus Moranbacteria bacterium]
MINNIIVGAYLEKVYFGNTIAQYIDALLYFVIFLAILFVLQRFLMAHFKRFAKKTKTEFDDVFVEFVQSIRPRLYIILSLYIALHTLNLSVVVQSGINIILIVIVIFQITRSAQIIIEFFAKKVSSGTEEDEHIKSATHLLSTIVSIVVWIFGIMMILSNIGVNITSLVAGVGIGGIAIAFAVKEMLSDLFASFSIYFDKPFKAGDAVKIGDDVGVVKKIGIKTTRIVSRTGEELVVSNQDMTSSRVHNYKTMDYRNVRSYFHVSFDTSADVLRQIPDDIAEIIAQIEHVECKRVHLKEFGEWGLLFEIMYVVDSRDYTLHINAQHAINIGIKEMFDNKKIEFACPPDMKERRL